MLTIMRMHPRNGIEFKLTEINRTQTRIEFNGKSVVFDLPISDVSQRWYNWQMRGMFIQEAFDVVPKELREFLMTGLTPTEWDSIFKEKE